MALFKEDIVGIDMGDGYVAAAVVSCDGPRIRLRRAGWAPVPEGASPSEAAAVVRRLWRKHRFSAYTVAASLRSRAMSVKYFSHPGLEGRELESALRLEAEEAVQVSFDQLYFDWQQRAASPMETGQTKRLSSEGLLVAAPRQEVRKHLSILTEAGLYPVIVDASCTAAANLFLALHGRDIEEPVCVVTLSIGSADIAVLRGHAFAYPRSVFFPANRQPQAVADYVAESTKELAKYCEFKLRQDPVRKVFVAGCLSCVDGLEGKLKAALSVPVEHWEPVADVSWKSSAVRGVMRGDSELADRLPVAMGLALRSR